MQETELSIDVATREDLETIIDWAAAEGWNPGLNDAGCYHLADRRGFLLGRLDGEVVAAISVVRYSDTFGFLGFYMVRPDMRGRGHGLRIWKAGLEYLQGCVIGLDGVIEQQHNYRKSGFHPAFRNIRCEAPARADLLPNTAIAPLAGLPFVAIENYMQAFFPASRPEFLRAWIDQPGATALGCISGGSLTGIGVIRPCRNGYKIGPLVADHADDASALWMALVATAPPGAPVFLDVPESNPDAVAMIERFGMQRVFETARMYQGEAPDLSIARQYGITSFEIG
ncbi:GNAT family N-acetyltransferase [Dokdonella sp.]|uniref:GNAT family N-acetyltransferase n=1 Tax=Dokdonella sp. TaxID=2291710 RepID=UPI003C4E642D